MKKLFISSGMITLVFGILFLFGVLDFNHTVGRAMVTGNRLYGTEEFDKALEAYAAGLQKEPENPTLNFNAAQASYRLKAYDKAIGFYDKASATADLYLNAGNSSLRLGDSTEEENQKIQLYTAALETYKQGILAFPQNVELKFNYEFAFEKLKALKDNMQNQQQQNNQEKQEGQEQDQQGQNNQEDNQQNQQNQQGNEGNSSDNQQNSEENQSNPNQGEDMQQQNPEDQQSGESAQDNEQNPEEQQSGTSRQDNEQNPEEQQSGESGQDEQQQEETDGQQAESTPASINEENNDATVEGAVLNSSELERILQMLEMQEEEALKNNQQIRDSGKEDEHDW
ncbi:MAG: tetratricopeptide repeat protein [Thermoclostridium sp.]|nr:tetratricopeptide repeat protein [Thermoclostridium sp.]